MSNTLSVKSLLELSENSEVIFDSKNNADEIHDNRFIRAYSNESRKERIISDDNYTEYFGKTVFIPIRLGKPFIHKLHLTACRFLDNTEDVERYIHYQLMIPEPIPKISMNSTLKAKRCIPSPKTADFHNMCQQFKDTNEPYPDGISREFIDLILRQDPESFDEVWYKEMMNFTVYLSSLYPFIDIYRKVKSHGEFEDDITILNHTLYKIVNPELHRFKIRDTQPFIGIQRKSTWANTPKNTAYYVRYKKEHEDDDALDERLLKLYSLYIMGRNNLTYTRDMRFDKSEVVDGYLRNTSKTRYYLMVLKFLVTVYPDLTVNDLQILNTAIQGIKVPSPFKIHRNLTCQKLKDRVLYLHDRNTSIIRNGNYVYCGNWDQYF